MLLVIGAIVFVVLVFIVVSQIPSSPKKGFGVRAAIGQASVVPPGTIVGAGGLARARGHGDR